MDKKKIILDAIIILLALIIFIIWYERKFEAAPATLPRRPVVYLITMDKKDVFWHIMDRGASDMARMLNITYNWVAPENESVQEQVELINRAVEAGANAIMLAALEPVGVSTAVEDAKAAGVHIIYVDAPAVEEGDIILATDNYQAGRLAAETMLSEFSEIGISGGSIGIISHIPISFTVENRERGFRDVMEEDGRFILLETKYTDGTPEDAQEAAKEFIADNGKLVGLFAVNEGTTVGTGRALAASKDNIIGIGFDINDTIRELIQNGALNAVMVQNPYTMGYLGMAEAVAAIRGLDTGPDFINTGISVFNRFSQYN